MYLVINLTVADMFVGGFSHFSLLRGLSQYSCEIVKMNFSQELDVIIDFLFLWFPLTSLTSNSNNSSLQASPHQKVGLRGNNCWSLCFSCNGIKCHFNTFRIWEGTVVSSLLLAIILLFVSFSYLCFLLFHCY